MKKYKFTISLIILVVFMVGVPAILSFGIRRIPDFAQPSLKNVFPVFGTQTIAQTFTAKDNNLSGVGMSIKNPNLRNTKELVLTISDNEGKELRKISKFGSTIADGNFVNFDFEPISDSSCKPYIVKLSATDSREDESLEVFLTDEPNENLAGLVLDSETSVGNTISMVSFYKPGGVLILPTKIYANWFGRLIGDKFFGVPYLIVICGLIGYLIFLEYKK